MDRVLRSTRPALTTELRDKQGNLLDADTGTQVTFQAYDSAGVAVGAQIVATRASLGTYEVTPAAVVTATLDLYRALWTATLGGAAVSFEYLFEVVGRFLFSTQELRDYEPAFADATAFSQDKLRVARETAEERIEALCGVAFRPRGARALLDGNGGDQILLPDLFPTKLVSAKIGTTAFSVDDLSDVALYPYGALRRKDRGIWTTGIKNVEVFYEHGISEAPEPVRRAAMRLATEVLIRAKVFNRAEGLPTDEATSTAAGGGMTGIPEVDAVIEQFGHPRPVLA